jgi:hypothetical protein
MTFNVWCLPSVPVLLLPAASNSGLASALGALGAACVTALADEEGWSGVVVSAAMDTEQVSHDGARRFSAWRPPSRPDARHPAA